MTLSRAANNILFFLQIRLLVKEILKYLNIATFSNLSSIV